MRALDMNDKQRFLWIDAVKGLGITMMFLGHMRISDPLLDFIYSFHMPLFVMISGFLFCADGSLVTHLKRRAKALLLPYLCTNIAALSVRLILLTIAGSFTLSGALGIAGAQTKATILGMGFARNLFTNTESVGPIWFVPFLFGVYVMSLLLSGLCKQSSRIGRIAEFATVILLSFAGYYIGTKIAFLPWSLDASLVALPLFYVGTKLKQRRFFEWKYSGLIAWPLAAFWLVFYRTSGMVALVTRAYETFPLCLLTALSACIFILYAFRLAELKLKLTPVLRPLAWCGRHSMLLLAVHTVELWHIGWLDSIQNKCPNLLCSYVVYLALLVGIAWAILLGTKFISDILDRGRSASPHKYK